MMQTNTELLAESLTLAEFSNILRGLGYEVTFAPVMGVTPSGEHFVWHKPFINKNECLKALNEFKR